METKTRRRIHNSQLPVSIPSHTNPHQVQAVSCLQVSPPKVCMHFSSLPQVPPTSPTSPEISLTNEPSRLNGVLVEKLAVAQCFKKLPDVYESQKLISVSKLTVNSCTCPRTQHHYCMYRLLFIATFREHQCILNDTHSVSTQLCQLHTERRQRI